MRKFKARKSDIFIIEFAVDFLHHFFSQVETAPHIFPHPDHIIQWHFEFILIYTFRLVLIYIFKAYLSLSPYEIQYSLLVLFFVFLGLFTIIAQVCPTDQAEGVTRLYTFIA